ncbi:hypothetical protein M1466_02820 [Candidatus Dependentiae bacterium]|nr:hypothetical protein [Candidatus Dependentiae bacterium]
MIILRRLLLIGIIAGGWAVQAQAMVKLDDELIQGAFCLQANDKERNRRFAIAIAGQDWISLAYLIDIVGMKLPDVMQQLPFNERLPFFTFYEERQVDDTYACYAAIVHNDTKQIDALLRSSSGARTMLLRWYREIFDMPLHDEVKELLLRVLLSFALCTANLQLAEKIITLARTKGLSSLLPSLVSANDILALINTSQWSVLAFIHRHQLCESIAKQEELTIPSVIIRLAAIVDANGDSLTAPRVCLTGIARDTHEDKKVQKLRKPITWRLSARLPTGDDWFTEE